MGTVRQKGRQEDQNNRQASLLLFFCLFVFFKAEIPHFSFPSYIHIHSNNTKTVFLIIDGKSQGT